jgi:hypothetical protein
VKNVKYYGIPGYEYIEVEVKEDATMAEIRQAALEKIEVKEIGK